MRRRAATATFVLLGVLAGCDASVDARAFRDGSMRDAAREDADVTSDAAVAPDAFAPDAFVSPDAGPPPPPSGRVIYTDDRSVSPITDDVATGLRAIADRGSAREDVFAKIGDSITVSTSFLDCFDGTRVDFDGRAALVETRDFFAAADVGGVSPFSRTSLAATVGWSASAPLAGSPSPLTRELDATTPRYASVMYGSNDVGFRTPFDFAANMLDITDTLLERGVIPVLSSIPPRDDDAAADARVPLFDLLVRGIAQGRQIPFVDLHRELAALPGHGLGPDHVHPEAFSGGACILTAEGLGHGYNQRNLLVLRALDRARRARMGEPAPDATATRIEGDGTFERPFLVRALPFTDVRSTALTGERRIATYACATANEGGPELVYRIELASATRLHAWVVDRGAVDIDLQLLDASGSAAGCLVRNDREVQADLAAGTYYLSLDSYVTSDGVEHAGEYLLAIAAD